MNNLQLVWAKRAYDALYTALGHALLGEPETQS